MSRQSEAKKARRNKRRAARDANWVPQDVVEDVADDLELVDVLERFDELITSRGWNFSEELSDEDAAMWFWPPSLDEGGDDEDVAPVTTIVMFADDDAEIANVMFVGSRDGYAFPTEELLGHLDVLEAYRLGDPPPAFN